MILVIAEKPAMGRDIAQALSVMKSRPVERSDIAPQAQTVGDVTVIGAQGHLFSLASPEIYGEQFAFPWRIEALPVLPDQFVLEPNFTRNLGKVVENDMTKAIRSRLSQIKNLLAKAKEVVHAGDPDREGQLIIDDVLRQFGFKGPVKRLWLHAQTLDGIQEAWKKMGDNATYKNLGIAALARRESDWAIGMNATRAYTALWWKRGHKGVLNIGRVMTPVIGMIVQREKDIRKFVSIDHYTLHAHINIAQNPSFKAAWIKPTGEPPIFDQSGQLIVGRAYVEAVINKCNRDTAVISSAEKKPKSEAPPLLLNLTELQKLAAKLGYAPDQVLAAAQSLYEKHKLTSYPRTECQYAPESEQLKASSVIQSILSNFSNTWNIPTQYKNSQKSRSWDDSKLAEHYAILPLSTKVSVSALSQIENHVYQLICRAYLAQFLPNYQSMSTVIIASVSGERFKATGSIPVELGWRVLYGGAAKKDPNDDAAQEDLPDVKEGDMGIAKPVELVAKKTEPPKRFTAITLLEAMEKAYLFVTDEKAKASLKQMEGIGTSATRAAIISKIVTVGFAMEEKAGKVIAYVPTAKAFTYIDCVPEVLAKPDLTAWFEGKLEELKDGSLSYMQYRTLLAKLVDRSIQTSKDGTAIHKIPKPEDMPAELAVKKGKRSPSANKASGAKKAPASKSKKLKGFF